MSRRYCHVERGIETEYPKEQEPRLETSCNEGQNGTDNTYVAEKIVRHICSELASDM